MSEFKIIKQDKKGNIEKAAIVNAVAFYTNFKVRKPIYDERKLPNPKNFEWTIDLVVDEDTADAYDATVSDKQSSKKVLKNDLAKRYKLVDDDGKVDDDKFREMNLDPSQKKFYIIKKSQRCQTKAGKSLEHLQPRVIMTVDGKAKDITFEKLVGNGSVVSLLMRYQDQGDYGVSSYPDKLKVETLIEYEQSGDGGLSDEEKDFLGGDVEFAEAPEEKETTVQSQGDEEESDEVPFDTDDDEEDDEY